jgi:hypothetical protein
MFRDKGNPNLPRHALWRPGMDWDAIGALDPHVKHQVTEGASDSHARLADMDAMGVDQALLYPTWFAEGFFPVRDPDVAYALARAYNASERVSQFPYFLDCGPTVGCDQCLEVGLWANVWLLYSTPLPMKALGRGMRAGHS